MGLADVSFRYSLSGLVVGIMVHGRARSVTGGLCGVWLGAKAVCVYIESEFAPRTGRFLMSLRQIKRKPLWIPGIIIGSLLAPKLPERLLRSLLACVLLLVSLKLMGLF